MPAQATAVVARRAQYVTMLIGANDACTGSESSMTAVATFRGHIDTALSRLRTGLPGAQVIVISIPDIQRLWDIGRVNSGARYRLVALWHLQVDAGEPDVHRGG